MSSIRSRAPLALLLAVVLASSGCAAVMPVADARPATGGAPAIDAAPAISGAPSTPTASPAAASPGETTGTTPTPPTIVTIGDSIMAGYGLDAGDDWPSLLAARTGASVTNLACSGAGFVAEGDCGTDFSGLVDAAIAASPTIVILQSSDNDDGESDASIADAAMSIVAALHAALPDATIIGINTLWNQPYDEPDEVASSTEALRTAVETVGGTFVDIGQPLQNGDGLMQFDDEHPSPAGQQVLLDAITSALAGADIFL